jgi:hypothetical protein
MYYESGEVSPASTDDSSSTFYDSPHTSDDARLMDERACGDAHTNVVGLPAYTTYDPSTGFPRGVITAEQYSYPAGQEAVQRHTSTATYYEDASEFQHPFSQLSYQADYATGDDPARAAAAVRPQEFVERSPSGDNQRSLYLGANGKPQRASVRASTKIPNRTESPMAHLPYPDAEATPTGPTPPVGPHAAQRFYMSSSSPFTFASSQMPHVAHPQPSYAHPHYSTLAHHPHHPHPHHPYPTSIAIPAPRSPPLVEDTPKKPLTLACFFCRKRKIACGSPPPGSKDRTCK